VVLGNGARASFSTNDYFYYYKNLKSRFLQTHQDFSAQDHPNPADSSSWGRWSTYAESLFKEADHLCQIATITKSQIKKFNKAGIFTTKALIETKLDRIKGINSDVFERLKAQATIQNAVDAMMKSETSVLAATTAFGKTVIAAWLIAKRQVNTLIIVHTKQLQDQWIERLHTFLEIPTNKMGRIGGGRKKITGLIDIALVQTLIRNDDVESLINQYGHIVVDECHHIPSRSFDDVIRQAKARFITGLSATIARKDGQHPIITMRCGPIQYRVNAKQQAVARPFEHYVIVRPTSFRPLKQIDDDLRIQFQDLNGELINDDDRNKLICDDVIQALKRGRSPVIITERNEHLDLLYQCLISKVQHLIVLRGGLNAKEMKLAVSQLNSIPLDEERVLLATGKFIGEGFDDARLDTLFLTLPISWKGTITQYVGRLHRLHDSKKEVQVYDYADLAVPMLERMFNRRCKAYEAAGYKMILPASAYPGWPSDVTLPAEPGWKNDYAGSIRRLVRDGLDVSLAQLFADAARQDGSDTVGIERARSSIEAFLFYRLESLR